MTRTSVLSWRQLLIIVLVLLVPSGAGKTPFSAKSHRRGILSFPKNQEDIHDLRQQSSQPRQSYRYLGVRGGFSSHVMESKTFCWMALLTGILLDTLSTTMMKTASNEKSLSRLCLAYCGYFLSLSGFGLSLSALDVSIAYAVWAALGTSIVAAVGIVRFGEECNVAKLCCLAMVVIGVIGLNLIEGH